MSTLTRQALYDLVWSEPVRMDHPNAKPGMWGEHAARRGPVGPLKLELKSH